MQSPQSIINSIIELREKNTNKILDHKKIKLEKSISKYSSNKEEIWHMILDNKIITRKSDYLFKYKCLNCSSTHIVSSTQFTRRLLRMDSSI